MKKRSFAASFVCCLMVAAAAFAQSDSNSPGEGSDMPMQPMEEYSPIVQDAQIPDDQVPGTIVQPGIQGGASCLDCPSGNAAGNSMGGCADSMGSPMMGQPMMGQPMMGQTYSGDGTGYQAMDGSGCGCSSGYSSYAPSYDSYSMGSSYGGCSSCGGCDSFGYSDGGCCGSSRGFWNRGSGWFGGSGGSGWYGRRSSCCGY